MTNFNLIYIKVDFYIGSEIVSPISMIFLGNHGSDLTFLFATTEELYMES